MLSFQFLKYNLFLINKKKSLSDGTIINLEHCVFSMNVIWEGEYLKAPVLRGLQWLT